MSDIDRIKWWFIITILLIGALNHIELRAIQSTNQTVDLLNKKQTFTNNTLIEEIDRLRSLHEEKE